MAHLPNQVRNRVVRASILGLLFAVSALLTSTGIASPMNSSLEAPLEMNPRIEFWERIFRDYDSKTIVIHDFKDPELILDVLPFAKMGSGKSDKLILNSSAQKALSDKYQRRYEMALRQFSRLGIEAKNLGAMEDRVYEVYRKNRQALARLLNGTAAIRQQRGMADIFRSAAEKAQDFLPYLESEFKAQGVPTELTRIAFVESMFNEAAISKVGASGMFQFMPGTAQSYMIVNQLIDERNSPIKSARAAAQLFKSNFQDLGNWPLAITAYNHGPGGMARAVKALRSDSLLYLIEKWKAPSFGFASQNFYAEFIAARNTYNKMIKNGSVALRPSKLRLGSGKLKQSISLRELGNSINLNTSEILRLNPCINKKVAQRNPYLKLPKGFELLLPVEMSRSTSTALIAFNGNLAQKRIAYDTRPNNRRGEQ
jgi:membrane-bound lytic murein transglycosylase D